MPAVNKITPVVQEVKGKSDNHDDIDEELANGPIENRSCRDMLCCLLFIVFFGGMFGVASYALSNGNPSIIGRGYDSDGKMCGISSGYEKYPYLYFAVPVKPYLTETLCVSECPTSTSSSSILKCRTNTLHATCAKKEHTNPQSGDLFYYTTVSFLERICVPTQAATLAKDASHSILSAGILEQWISDIKTTWQVIAVSVGLAFIIGLIYTILLRWCSGVLTWVAIASFVVGTAMLGWRFLDTANQLKKQVEKTNAANDDQSNIQQTIKADLIIAYICFGLAGAAVLLTICLYQRIKLAIAILKAAADFVRTNKSIFLLPIVSILYLAIFFGFWAVVVIYLVSCGNTAQIQNTPFGTFSFDKKLQHLLIYHLFGLLWFSAFVVAATQFIIASSVSIWYFAQGTGQGCSGNIRKSVWRFFRYHFGSICFGSLILALVQLVRVILAYMQAQAQRAGGKQNKVSQFAFKCLQCYLSCFERFIKFLNKNAYIQIALSGKSFCFAAKDGFLLAMKNPLRVGVLYGITGVFVWFGKVFISALTTLAAYLAITKWARYSAELYSPIIPSLIVFVFAFAIAGVFMTIYGMAAEGILACFVLDEELNKKKNAPPRHCPESLMPFLDMHNKKMN